MKERIEMKSVRKILRTNLILALLLFGLIFINKTVFRPAFNTTHFEQILTGSFPNFIAALLLGLCVVNPVLNKKPRFGRLIVYALSLCIMSVLILDETKSIAASETYDIYDIIGSISGSVLAILIYEYLFYRLNLKKK
jgi:hypothetical protein